MSCWLVKQEPSDYGWEQFERDGKTSWTGVRNFQARNFLKEMKKGDAVLFYHSGSGKEIVGLAKITREHYPDPTAHEGDWVAVELVPEKRFPTPISLAQIKEDPEFKDLLLVRHTRLSVMPVPERLFRKLLKMGGC
jgi:predicted RNA-binding protein with PUA-like domain